MARRTRDSAACSTASRISYPEELERGLQAAGFEMLALADNHEFRASDLRGAPTETSDPGGMRGRKLYAWRGGGGEAPIASGRHVDHPRRRHPAT